MLYVVIKCFGVAQTCIAKFYSNLPNMDETVYKPDKIAFAEIVTLVTGALDTLAHLQLKIFIFLHLFIICYFLI